MAMDGIAAANLNLPECLNVQMTFGMDFDMEMVCHQC